MTDRHGKTSQSWQWTPMGTGPMVEQTNVY